MIGRLSALLFCGLVLAANTAAAQQPARPTGTFTPGHALRSNTPSGSPYSDAGSSAGSAIFGSGYLTELGITNTGLPLCINDALTSSPSGYHRLCFGHGADGSGLITVDGIGGADAAGCNFVIDGITTPCTGSNATTLPMIRTNAAVKALAAASSIAIQRLGFTTAGDGGEGTYNWSGTACSLNGGDGDNGTQIAPNIGTGCWLLTKQSQYDVRQWGVAVGNPIHLEVSLSGSDTYMCGIVAAAPCRTITGAQTTANLLDSNGNVIEADLPANATFIECVSQTQPLRGAITARPNPRTPTVALGPTMFLVKGQGPTTIWDGCPSYFYTFQASNGAAIGIQDLQIRSTGVPLYQLSFAMEQGGQGFSLGGITWGATNNVHVWAQDPGSLVILAGHDAITNGANAFADASGGAAIQVLGGVLTWTADLSAGLTFSDAFIRVALGGQFVDNNTGGHAFGNTITGRPLVLSGLSLFANQTNQSLPALLPAGTLPSLEYSGARVVPQPASTITVASTGCGTTCTTTIQSQSPRAGFVTITPGGTGISSSGGLNVGQGIALIGDNGSFSPCVIGGITSGTGSWSIGAVFQASFPSIVSPTTVAYTINWSNNAINLTSGQSYVMSFVCSDS